MVMLIHCNLSIILLFEYPMQTSLFNKTFIRVYHVLMSMWSPYGHQVVTMRSPGGHRWSQVVIDGHDFGHRWSRL